MSFAVKLKKLHALMPREDVYKLAETLFTALKPTSPGKLCDFCGMHTTQIALPVEFKTYCLERDELHQDLIIRKYWCSSCEKESHVEVSTYDYKPF